MSAPSSTPRRLRADALRNRQALIDAAQRLYRTRGLSVTLDDIATEAGVNVATAYRHFANKQELAQAYLAQQLDQAISIAEDAAAAEDPWQGLVDFLSKTLSLIVSNRGLHDVCLPGQDPDWFDRLGEQIERVLDGLVVRARAAGVLHPDVELGDVGVVLQMLTAVTDIPTSDPRTLVDRYLAILLAGLRPSNVALRGSAPSPSDVRSSNPLHPRRSGRQHRSSGVQGTPTDPSPAGC